MLIARFTDSRMLAAFFALCVALWTGTLMGVALAEEGEDTPASEEDVPIAVPDVLIVDSAPESSLLFEDPSASTERIEVADFRDRVTDLADLLGTATGIRVVSFGGIGRTATIQIRGGGGRQVLVLLDGVPLNSAGGAVDLSTIPLDQLVAVEITRGGASALYGGGAVGGVINLISVQPPADGTTTAGNLRLSVGSFATTESLFTTSRSAAHHHQLFQIQQQNTRGNFGFTNDNGTSFNPGDDFRDTRDNNEAHSTALLWRQRWTAADQSLFALTASAFWRIRGEPGIVTFPSVESDLRETRLLFDATYRRPDWWWPGSTTELKLFGRLLGSSFQDPTGEQTGIPLSVVQRDTLAGVRAGTTWSVGEDQIWTGVVEATWEALEDASSARVFQGTTPERTSLSASLRDEWYLAPDWTLVAAARADLFSDQPGRISPKIGIKFTPDDEWTLTANATNAYRPPSFSELAENRGFVVGNPDLRPEVARTLDLGAEWTADESRFSATLFQTDTRDLIEYVQIGGFRFKPLNFGLTQARGLELSAAHRLADQWRLEGDWTWQTVEDRTGGANRSGAQIPGQPRSFGNLELLGESGAFKGSVTWSLVGPNAVTFANTKRIPARRTLDAALTWSPNATESLGLQIANLLDASVSDLRGFPLPGRSLSLTYTRHW